MRQGEITAVDAAVAVASFDAGVHLFRVLPVAEEVLNRARTLLDAHAVPDKLRPPDAIQIASALLEHQANTIDTFVSADHEQRSVASANGLVLFP